MGSHDSTVEVHIGGSIPQTPSPLVKGSLQNISFGPFRTPSSEHS